MADKEITVFLIGNKCDLSVIRFLTYYKISNNIEKLLEMMEYN